MIIYDTYSIGYVNVRWRNLFAMLIGLLDLFHVPYTQRCSSELRPDIRPSLVLRGSMPVGLSLDPSYQRPREIDFVSMGDRELYD